MKSFHFSIGNSTDGQVGFCARIIAENKEDALESLFEKFSGGESFTLWDKGSDDYGEVYFNTSTITINDIDEVDGEEGDASDW